MLNVKINLIFFHVSLQDSQRSHRICDVCLNKLSVAYEFYHQCMLRLTSTKKTVPSSVAGIKSKYRPICRKPSTAPQIDIRIARHFRCKTCRQRFPTKYDLAIHRSRVHLNQPDPEFFCERCSKQFHTKHTLGLHCKLHEDLICTFCNTAFSSEPTLNDHISQIHSDTFSNRFVCVKCAKRFGKRSLLLRHSRLIHQETQPVFGCGVCRSHESTSRPELREHVAQCPAIVGNKESSVDNVPADQSNEEEMPAEFLNYSLLDDDDYFDAKDLLLGDGDDNQTHPMGMVEEFLDEAFQISYDPSVLNMLMNELGKGGTAIHQQDQSALQNGYKCPRSNCVSSFDSQHELNLHLAEQHDESVLVCNECAANFNRAEALIEHRNQHKHENRLANESLSTFFGHRQSAAVDERFSQSIDSSGNTVFECKYCARTYKTSTNMLKHQCSATSPNQQPAASQPRECPECSATFSTQLAFAAHRKHHIADALCCSLCDKKFTSIAGLKYHLKTHSGIRSISCPFCARNFMANGNLHAHIRAVHSTVRPHACEECDQRFGSIYHLRRHVASVHRKERDFACPTCDKRFLQQSHLAQHSWLHTGVKPYPCEQCEAAYTSRSALNKHLQKGHGVVVQPSVEL